MNREKWKRSLLAAMFALALWQAVAVTVEALRGIPFPKPLECAVAFLQLLAGEKFLGHTVYRHTGASCLRWLEGFVLSLAAGLGYSFLAGWSRRFRDITMPTVEILQLIPGLAWIPVAILLFGLGPAATVAIILLTTFPIVAVAGVMGVRSVDRRYVRAGLMCGYRGWRLFLTVFLPGAVPHFLSGLRIALGASWRVLIAAEMVVGSGDGLGYAIIQSRWTMDYVTAFVCIGVIAALGLVIERLVLLPLEKRTILRWGLANDA